ncbi:G-type lectin S-receptor-like serine/threonine-protein kinase At5g35370 [Andrographis paniculata]|uniref:G-type lectin S-receptor-like serine/threonine-protein kinase At5g35370 n=1 Tax=Andrographis paniculata TaxID=175694 RepID=UPI0021E99074|nr:G-type lectin S-receptor-like serine/threonine-protein kinase At5g35370 [Andrographis paniculata]
MPLLSYIHAALRRRMGFSGVALTHLPPPFFSAVFLLFFSPMAVLSGPVSVSSISPNFTASYYSFIDSSGAFLSSPDTTFQARISSINSDSKSFYFVVVHVPSNAVIWSANRNSPISQSSELRFSNYGLALYDDSGSPPPVWSTPENISAAASLRLLESGNLALLDSANVSLWQSFDHPTDVIVPGQNLTVGKPLISSSTDSNFSEGNYRLVLSDDDAMLQWKGMTYWKMSMDPRAFRHTAAATVEYMMMNTSGVYLMGKNGINHLDAIVIISIEFNDSSGDDSMSFRTIKLDHNGAVDIVKTSAKYASNVREFTSPVDSCRTPYICGSLGVCSNGGYCRCALSFHPGTSNSECVPAEGSNLAMEGSCNSSIMSSINYLSLREDLDYVLNDFVDPTMVNANLSTCQRSCSTNCSCMGVFYVRNSGSCYFVTDSFGSLVIKSSSTSDGSRMGYVKVVNNNVVSSEKLRKFPILVVALLLPLLAIVAVISVASLIWFRRAKTSKIDRGYASPLSFENGDELFDSIPGLPVAFDYNNLFTATKGFATKIGAGGFGSVYKGTLPDGTDVAVKKITCLGSQGKREFLSEIAAIGKVHHVNLVRLKGFCAENGQRLLVYEFMNRGSIDRTLFEGGDCVLGWDERFGIALGAARGLAYLHSGCEYTIIHCDIKPENILVDDKLHVKISDFGLSKLVGPDESGIFTTMRGTRGYLAPEWLTGASISDKTDVYSYGMMLFELVSGKKNSSLQHRSGSGDGPGGSNRAVYFPLLALEMHEEKRYVELVDRRLGGRVGVEGVEKVVRVALWCVQEEPRRRPSMANVVGMLEGGVAVAEPEVEGLNFLRFYGRRLAEAGGEEVAFYEQPESGFNRSYDSLSSYMSDGISGAR